MYPAANRNPYEGSSSDEIDELEERAEKMMDDSVNSDRGRLQREGSIPGIGRLVKFIPMRLSEEERVLLKVLENALEVCEYTDVVDVAFSHTHKTKYSRILECLIDVLSISLGLLMANNLVKGENMIIDKSLNANIPFFRDLFEVGRRFKIMNPHKMRNTYGKLMYILMDCESHQVRSNTGASFVKEICTIHEFLKSKNVDMRFIHEPDLAVASSIIEQNVEMEDADTNAESEIEEGVSSSVTRELHDSSSPNVAAMDVQSPSNAGDIMDSDDEAAYEDPHEAPERSCSSEHRRKNLKGDSGDSSTGSGIRRTRSGLIRSSRRKSNEELKQETDAKTRACESLIQKYASNEFTRKDIIRVIESISDNRAYHVFNVKPVEQMITLLKEFFNKKTPPNVGPNSHLFSLDISSNGRSGKYNSRQSNYGYMNSFTNLYEGFSLFNNGFGGRGGAKLSHDHSTQFTYVLQSLSFWKATMEHMPLLWYYADRDMCSEHYRLCDTGQGYQRVQQCPNVRDIMSRILRDVQRSCEDRWVGLAVIHLGDRDVPNALVFIDKYTQIPRMLSPIVNCVHTLLTLQQETALGMASEQGADFFNNYIKAEWGSVDCAVLQILSSFFKNGFDGSGDDGGSCIDGRLTSAWNWCSKIQKKPFYYVFMYTGFQGFDGEWKE